MLKTAIALAALVPAALAGGFANICNSAPAPNQATLVNTDIAGL